VKKVAIKISQDVVIFLSGDGSVQLNTNIPPGAIGKSITINLDAFQMAAITTVREMVMMEDKLNDDKPQRDTSQVHGFEH